MDASHIYCVIVKLRRLTLVLLIYPALEITIYYYTAKNSSQPAIHTTEIYMQNIRF